MKYLYLFYAAAFVCVHPAAQVFDWNALYSGAWEESKTLHDRIDLKMNWLPYLGARFQTLDRRTLNFKLDKPFGDPEKAVTSFMGALYHKPTGSRLLYGVLDEWGLSARIRNPWIRSAPYSGNHKPLMADLKTAASAAKEDEAYVYLSSPSINLAKVNLRTFASAQTAIENPAPVLSLGLNTVFNKQTSLLTEAFYMNKTLTAKSASTWFADLPPLPEREFDLFAFGLLFTGSYFSLSSDLALSQTFARGRDIYANLGISINPVKSLLIAFAADGAGERFVSRDGLDHGSNFRTAGKIEYKGKRSSLARLATVLRGPSFDKGFNRGSISTYYRFPARSAKDSSSFPVRFTRVTLDIDRNAVNLSKIDDKISANIGFSFIMPKKIKPIGLNLSCFFKERTSSDEIPFPYPFLNETHDYDSAGGSGELSWSPGIFQFKTKLAYTNFAKKDDTWDLSLSAAVRFKYGRFSLKASFPELGEKWNLTAAWKFEGKK
ncbi:MAG: hypothetical protein LBB81_09140 [Treponema sp.]|jgi:hypothetical protein|nr:hypothetical protein [Treponema sp.]